MLNRRELLKWVPAGVAGGLLSFILPKKLFSAEKSIGKYDGLTKTYMFDGYKIHQKAFIYPKEDFDEKHNYLFAHKKNYPVAYVCMTKTGVTRHPIRTYFDKLDDYCLPQIQENEVREDAVFASKKMIQRYVERELDVYIHYNKERVDLDTKDSQKVPITIERARLIEKLCNGIISQRTTQEIDEIMSSKILYVGIYTREDKPFIGVHINKEPLEQLLYITKIGNNNMNYMEMKRYG